MALAVTNTPANGGHIRNVGLIPEGGHGNPFQHSSLENPHGQRSLGATVHRVAQSGT